MQRSAAEQRNRRQPLINRAPPVTSDTDARTTVRSPRSPAKQNQCTACLKTSARAWSTAGSGSETRATQLEKQLEGS